MYANRRNFRVLKEIRVEEHDGDVIFQTGSGNTAVSRMRNASGHNYWNSSVIVDLAMGRYHVTQNVFLVKFKSISCYLLHCFLWDVFVIGYTCYFWHSNDLKISAVNFM